MKRKECVCPNPEKQITNVCPVHGDFEHTVMKRKVKRPRRISGTTRKE